MNPSCVGIWLDQPRVCKDDPAEPAQRAGSADTLKNRFNDGF